MIYSFVQMPNVQALVLYFVNNPSQFLQSQPLGMNTIAHPGFSMPKHFSSFVHWGSCVLRTLQPYLILNLPNRLRLKRHGPIGPTSATTAMARKCVMDHFSDISPAASFLESVSK